MARQKVPGRPGESGELPLRFSIGSRPSYSFVLTSEGLWLAAPGRNVVHAPLSPGVLGARPDEELSHFHLHDPAALREAIRGCVAQNGRAVRHAHLALDGILIRTMSLPIPFTPPREELDLAVRAEAERYRIFAGMEIACDFEILESSENGLTVLVAAAQRSEIDGILAVFDEAGVAIDSLEPAPIAAFRGLSVATEAADSAFVTAFPSHLHVVMRAEGGLHSWRTVPVAMDDLRAGAAGAVAEARMEVLRSLHDLGERLCYLADLPAPLVTSLEGTQDLAFQSLDRSQPEGGFATQGALRYRQEPGIFDFELRRDRLKPPPKPVSRGVGLPLAFAGVLIAGLLVNLWLSDRVKAREAATEALLQDISTMQTEILRPDPHKEGRETLRAARLRSESAAALLRHFQDETPHDAWIARSELTADSKLVLEGYALSRQSPLTMAEALRRVPSLNAIEIPVVAQEELQGQKVFRFRVLADFSPQGGPRL